MCVTYIPVSIYPTIPLGEREGGLLSKEKSLSRGTGRKKGLTWAWEQCCASQLMSVQLPWPLQSHPRAPGIPPASLPAQSRGFHHCSPVVFQAGWNAGHCQGTGPALPATALLAHCFLMLTSTSKAPRCSHIHSSAPLPLSPSHPRYHLAPHTDFQQYNSLHPTHTPISPRSPIPEVHLRFVSGGFPPAGPGCSWLGAGHARGQNKEVEQVPGR